MENCVPYLLCSCWQPNGTKYIESSCPRIVPTTHRTHVIQVSTRPKCRGWVFFVLSQKSTPTDEAK